MTTAPTTADGARTPEQSARSLFTDVGSTAGAIERGDWIDAGIGATTVAMDIVGLSSDPLSPISSAGVGWVLESVSFLREPFDALLGDPGAIQSSARTWQRASSDLASVAQQYRDASMRQTQGWTGAAGDGYRSASAAQATGLEALSRASTGVAQAIDGAGRVLAQVRKTVLDLIGDAVGKIIQICVEALASSWMTGGSSIALGIAQSVRTATQTARKLASETQKLVSSMQKIIEIVRKLLNTIKAVKSLLDSIGGKATGGQPLPLSGTQVRTLPDGVVFAQASGEGDTAQRQLAIDVLRGIAKDRPYSVAAVALGPVEELYGWIGETQSGHIGEHYRNEVNELLRQPATEANIRRIAEVETEFWRTWGRGSVLGAVVPEGVRAYLLLRARGQLLDSLSPTERARAMQEMGMSPAE